MGVFPVGSVLGRLRVNRADLRQAPPYDVFHFRAAPRDAFSVWAD